MDYQPIVGFPSHRAKAAWTGGACAAGYPVTNLATAQTSAPWRSVDLSPANCRPTAVFPTPVKVGLVAVPRNNWSKSALWRVTLFADALCAQVIWCSGLMRVDDGGADAPPVVLQRPGL